MIVLYNALVVLLAQPAPAATCDFEDNHCKAARHERRAAAASKPDDRAYYLHLAHRSYLFAFDKSGDPVELCAARRAFDASLAIEGQSDKQRESTLVTRADLTAREGKTQTRCANKKNTHDRRTQKQKPKPLVADGGAWQAPRSSGLSSASPSVTLSAMTPSHGTVQAGPGDDASPPPSSVGLTPADPRILLPVRGRANARSPKALLSEGAPVEVRRARSGRSLVIGGGVTLGAGFVLAGVAGYLGGRTLDVRRQAAALEGMVDGFASDHQLAQDQQLTRDYERMGTQTLVLALTGGTTIVVAAVLLGVGGRRMARVASRTSLVPAPGGLVFRARF